MKHATNETLKFFETLPSKGLVEKKKNVENKVRSVWLKLSLWLQMVQSHIIQ